MFFAFQCNYRNPKLQTSDSVVFGGSLCSGIFNLNLNDMKNFVTSFIYSITYKFKNKAIMITYHVTIPNNKNSFFLEFLKLIGAEYQEEANFELTEEQKKLLDTALKQDKKTFISRDALSKKHNL